MQQIITIDGPSGSGKGTIADLLSRQLGWQVLDSGALYRILGLSVHRAGIGFEDADKIAKLAENMPAVFRDGAVLLDGEDVSLEIRTETAGNNASRVAAIPAVRDALLSWQRAYATGPGLVADGRDMGTVVFPDAQLKIFLDASAEERAKRRYNQLKEKGIDANFAALTAELEERDRRDRTRSVSPLVPAEDAIVIDSTGVGIEAVLEQILTEVQKTFQDTGTN